jgi:hypothetical protein
MSPMDPQLGDQTASVPDAASVAPSHRGRRSVRGRSSFTFREARLIRCQMSGLGMGASPPPPSVTAGGSPSGRPPSLEPSLG